ncbi:MAG: VOC family protein [Candidatus Omnitrophica bacterium]|nr:VOC family protein [Candidatus Omnitrophota bacterium]
MSLDAIGIVSKDMKAAIKFYGLLGVVLKEVGGADHYEGTTPSGVRIMLDSVQLMKDINPDWQEPSGSGIVLCFKQNSPADVDQMFSTITEAGFAAIKEPWDAFWGQRYSSVQDPDGNQIDIFAQL